MLDELYTDEERAEIEELHRGIEAAANNPHVIELSEWTLSNVDEEFDEKAYEKKAMELLKCFVPAVDTICRLNDEKLD